MPKRKKGEVTSSDTSDTDPETPSDEEDEFDEALLVSRGVRDYSKKNKEKNMEPDIADLGLFRYKM